MDSANVVPYNAYLTSKYGSHINGECCNSVKACKYLFKYVYKGRDKGKAHAARVAGANDATAARDEIAEYEDCRVVGTSEACWHLFTFQMSTCLLQLCRFPSTWRMGKGLSLVRNGFALLHFNLDQRHH